MAARGGVFCPVRWPRTYQERPMSNDMAETEIIERYTLSRGRINWLVERFRGDLERDTKRSCPLSAETQETMADFHSIAGFPKVIGAIDGSLIPIRGPNRDEHLYVCHKGFHAMNVMAVCNAHLSYTNVICRWHGSVHDLTVFNASNLQVRMEGGGGRNGWLLGDRGYGIQPYLMTPLQPDHVSTVSQTRYQKALMKTRNTIKRAFGLWKIRFQCLDHSGGALQSQPNCCCTIITATAFLHNIYDNTALPANVEDPPQQSGVAVDQWELIAGDNAAGSSVRDQLIKDVFS